MLFMCHYYLDFQMMLQEENPGPRAINDIVDPTYTVHVDFNQGSELMFGINAGKQCVSLYAIVYQEIKSVNI